MQAAKGVSGCGYNAYGSKPYGSLTPNYIYYQGEKYVINKLYTNFAGSTYIFFQNDIEPPVTNIIIEVNGRKYPMAKYAGYTGFENTNNIFTSTGKYIIKILSIE